MISLGEDARGIGEASNTLADGLPPGSASVESILERSLGRVDESRRKTSLPLFWDGVPKRDDDEPPLDRATSPLLISTSVDEPDSSVQFARLSSRLYAEDDPV